MVNLYELEGEKLIEALIQKIAEIDRNGRKVEDTYIRQDMEDLLEEELKHHKSLVHHVAQKNGAQIKPNGHVVFAGAWSTTKISRKTVQKVNAVIEPIVKKHTKQYLLCGSYRRGRDMVGDMDYVVTDANLSALLSSLDDKVKVLQIPQQGKSILTVIIQFGNLDVQIQFNNVKEKSFGSAQLHSTGSAKFNVGLRAYAKQKKYLLSQHGLFRGSEWIAGTTEEEVFRMLGLKWIPPVNRDYDFFKIKDAYKIPITQTQIGPVSKAGFFGTQEGMTAAQKKSFTKLIKEMKFKVFVHDDTVGAAGQAHDIVRDVLPKAKIHAYPPNNPKKRANKKVDKMHPSSGGLDRAWAIVEMTETLIATPKTAKEEQYAGTWQAMSYARGHSKPVIQINPDGEVIK